MATYVLSKRLCYRVLKPQQCTETESQEDSHCIYNAMPGRIRVSIVAVEGNK
jgi:hypothetical protein